MAITCVLVFIILTPLTVFATHLVSDTIEDDTVFYYRNLSKYPSKIAIVNYTVRFPRELISDNYVSLDMYTTDDNLNIRTNCSNKDYGQLYNKNLHTSLRRRPYRYTTCGSEQNNNNVIICTGHTKIQDYIPRKYGFSFGYECSTLIPDYIPRKYGFSFGYECSTLNPDKNLYGLSYNISMYGQTNETQCFPIPNAIERRMSIDCTDFYTKMSFPNMMGDLDIDSGMASLHKFYALLLIQSSPSHCYQYFNNVACYSFIPRCNDTDGQIIPLCKESCEDFSIGCGEISGLFPMNCSYLPSKAESIPCFYKPVTCSTPPYVPNAMILDDQNDTFSVLSKVKYKCTDEKYQMEGNNTIACLYSGQWSESPSCEGPSGFTNYLPWVLVSLVFLTVITVIIIIIRCRMRQKNYFQPIIRNRSFDAFVCFNSVKDIDYVRKQFCPS